MSDPGHLFWLFWLLQGFCCWYSGVYPSGSSSPPTSPWELQQSRESRRSRESQLPWLAWAGSPDKSSTRANPTHKTQRNEGLINGQFTTSHGGLLPQPKKKPKRLNSRDKTRGELTLQGAKILELEFGLDCVGTVPACLAT